MSRSYLDPDLNKLLNEAMTAILALTWDTVYRCYYGGGLPNNQNRGLYAKKTDYELIIFKAEWYVQRDSYYFSLFECLKFSISF